MFMPTETEVEVAHMLGAQQSGSGTSKESELEKLDEQELKAAIKSAWKKHEQLAKADMAPLLYWLRERLRAQGARNDIADSDRGFGTWVEHNLDISRRTADRWADDWGIAHDLKEPSKRVAPTSGQMSKSPGTPDGRVTVNVSFVVSEREHEQFLEAMEILGDDAHRIIYDAVVTATKKGPSHANQTNDYSAQA
jgi:hypothetical protein